MPAIKPTTRRVKETLAAIGRTVEDVARAIGRTPSFTIRVINGSMKSPPTSQALADFFGFSFHGMEPAPRPRALILPKGTKIGGLDPNYAEVLVEFFGDCTVNGAGELVLQRKRRLLFSPPRPISEDPAENQAP